MGVITPTLGAYVARLADGGTQTANFTAATNTRYLVNGTPTATLPAAPTAGDTVCFLNIGSGYAPINANTGQAILAGIVLGTVASVTLPPHQNDKGATSVTLTAMSATEWAITSTTLNEVGLGFTVSGGLYMLAGQTIQPETITTNHTIIGSDGFLNCTSAVTLTVGALDAVGEGQVFYIANSSTGTVTINCAGSGTVNGVASYSLASGDGVAIVVTSNLSANPTVVTLGGNPIPTQVGVDMASGNWYAPSSDAAITEANGVALYMPVVITRTGTISGTAVNVTSAGSTGSVVRMGIYSDNAGKPGTLIKDAGTIATTTTGVAYIGWTQAVTPGRYWLVAVGQGAPGTTPTLSSVGHTPLIVSDTAADVFTGAPGWYQTGITGALPRVGHTRWPWRPRLRRSDGGRVTTRVMTVI